MTTTPQPPRRPKLGTPQHRGEVASDPTRQELEGADGNVVEFTMPALRSETIVRTYTRTVLVGRDEAGDEVRVPLTEPELLEERIAE